MNALLMDELIGMTDSWAETIFIAKPGAEPRTRDRDDHRKIAEAVIAGEREKAVALVQSHIDNSLSAAALSLVPS
ncbi:FCD domain-containing protein [Luteococcus sanguinis]|uniref:FCD domain-containing protein n=1 Tax=Luteococcus sanguinis TaxID=174038 RepID=A0ABW1WZT1_9ACTN